VLRSPFMSGIVAVIFAAGLLVGLAYGIGARTIRNDADVVKAMGTQRYQPSAGLGSLVATMWPYSVTFLVGWTALLVVWIVADLPVGPGAGIALPQP
jgi:p-aminobenzoyl-glutamate transporter AbgT